MIDIELNNYPNQNKTISIEEDYYSLTFNSFNGYTLATISRNDELLIEGFLCLPNKNIIPFNGLSPKGNFRFVCITDDYPNYKEFGKSCILRWYTIDELNSIES